MNNQIIAIVLLCMGCSIVAWGQGPQVRTKIEQARKMYYTDQLQLSEKEVADFWPLYQQMKIEEDSLKRLYNTKQRFELMTDKEIESYLLRSIEFEEQKTQLKRKYLEIFREVLPIRKIAMIRQTEFRFKRELLKRWKDRRGNRRGGMEEALEDEF